MRKREETAILSSLLIRAHVSKGHGSCTWSPEGSEEHHRPSERTEEEMEEDRVRAFIELTRQALEEDRVGNIDVLYRPKLSAVRTHPEARRRGDRGKKA